MSAEDALLTPDMYHRLIALGQADVKDHTSVGGSALRKLYGMRRLVQVKPARARNVLSDTLDGRAKR